MSQQIIIDYWVEKAEEDLASARDNLKSGRYQRKWIDPGENTMIGFLIIGTRRIIGH